MRSHAWAIAMAIPVLKTELPAVIVILSSATKEEPAVSISKMYARFHVREIAVYSLIVMRSAIVISIAKT